MEFPARQHALVRIWHAVSHMLGILPEPCVEHVSLLRCAVIGLWRIDEAGHIPLPIRVALAEDPALVQSGGSEEEAAAARAVRPSDSPATKAWAANISLRCGACT